jgi:hypothetical protein
MAAFKAVDRWRRRRRAAQRERFEGKAGATAGVVQCTALNWLGSGARAGERAREFDVRIGGGISMRPRVFEEGGPQTQSDGV